MSNENIYFKISGSAPDGRPMVVLDERTGHSGRTIMPWCGRETRRSEEIADAYWKAVGGGSLQSPRDLNELEAAGRSLPIGVPERCKLYLDRLRRRLPSDQRLGTMPTFVPWLDENIGALPLELASWHGSAVPPRGLPIIRYSPAADRPVERSGRIRGGFTRTLLRETGVRPLVLCCHDLLSNEHEICRLLEREIRALEATARQGGGITADTIRNESSCMPVVIRMSSSEELDERLRSDPQRFNVVVYMGHMEPEAYASDRQAAFQLGVSGHPTGGNRPWAEPAEFAEVFARHPDVQIAVLLACQTWPSAVPQFVASGIPVVIGTHWQIGFGQQDLAHWIRSVASFLVTLSVRGTVDEAFDAMRCAADGNGQPGLRAAALAMHVNLPDPPRLRLLRAELEENEVAVRFAHAVRRACAGIKSHGEVRSRAGASTYAKFNDPRVFIERQLLRQIRVARPDRREDDPARDERAVPEREKTTIEAIPESQMGLVTRLLSGGRGAARLGLVANWGMGKTMLMRWIAHHLAERFLDNPEAPGVFVPVYIELWRLKDLLLQGRAIGGEVLHDAACKSMGVDDRGNALAAFSRNVSINRVFLLDGFDEAFGLRAALREALGPGGAFWGCPVLISSRPEAAQAAPDLDNFQGAAGVSAAQGDNVFELKPWTRAETEQFMRLCLSELKPEHIDTIVRNAGLGAGASSGTLAAELSSPYLASLYCDIARDSAGEPADEPIQTVTELLEQALPIILSRRSGGASGPAAETSLVLTERHAVPLAAVAFEAAIGQSRAWCEGKEDMWPGVHKTRVIEIIKQVLADMEKTAELGDLRLPNTILGQHGDHNLRYTAAAEEVLGTLTMHSGMLRLRSHANGAEYLTMNDARYAEFLPALHMARMIQGPSGRGVPDDQQPLHPARRYARKHGLILGWDNDESIEDPLDDAEGNEVRVKSSVREFIRRKAWDERHWGWPVQFLAGLLEDPAPLLNELVDAGLNA